MNTKNIILNTDSYKSSHYLQYPPKSEYVSSYIEARGGDVEKDPITDVGKRSKKGRLALTEQFETVRVEELDGRKNLLESVFRNGELLRDYRFDELLNA